MSKPKLEKFAEIETFPNVLRNVDFKNPALLDFRKEVLDLQGRWNTDFFKNENPVVLELACGKGDYTVGLAQLFPDKNFLGVDLKGNRLWTGAKKALELNLKNAAFIRTRIELLPHFFAKNEVSEIWITFPDPYRRNSKSGKRLTSSFFLDRYRQFCKPGAMIHLKTDDPALFEFSLEVAKQEGRIEEIIEDVYQNGTPKDILAIQTYYEKMHLEEGRVIRYLRFSL